MFQYMGKSYQRGPKKCTPVTQGMCAFQFCDAINIFLKVSIRNIRGRRECSESIQANITHEL